MLVPRVQLVELYTVVSHCTSVVCVIGTVVLSGQGIVIGVHTSDRSGNHHAAVYIVIAQYNAHSGEKQIALGPIQCTPEKSQINYNSSIQRTQWRKAKQILQHNTLIFQTQITVF